jgi:hypothetical protein
MQNSNFKAFLHYFLTSLFTIKKLAHFNLFSFLHYSIHSFMHLNSYHRFFQFKSFFQKLFDI